MRKLILLLFFTIPLIVFGQDTNTETHTISGKIIDAITHKPIDYATVIFKNTNSGDIVFGGITNQRGNFSIIVKKGTYDVTVEFVSYKTKKINISDINRDFNVGTIEIEADIESLNEVEIIAVKKALEVKNNKLVVNVEEDLSSTGNMVSDILNNIPSISVDPNGEVKLNGVENPTILIDGRVSMLTKSDALKSLPAGSVERIEVISNPSAKYKASSTGIINIILKKGENEGLNSSATGSIGYKEYYGGLVNLSYKTDKVNIYFMPSIYGKKVFKTADSDTEYLHNDIPTSYLKENSDFESKNNGFVSNLGADFYLTDKATFSTIFNYSKIKNESITNTTSSICDAQGSETGNNNRLHNGVFTDDIVEFNLNFTQQFKTVDQKLTTSLIYSTDEEKYDNNISNSHPNYTDESYIENNIITNYIVDIIYESPINETSAFDFGYYGEFGDIHFRESTIEGDIIINYDDNVHAIFGDYEKSFEKFYLMFGLRAEFTDLNVEYLDTNTVLNKNYNDLFPSLLMEHTINDNQNISLSFNRSIIRPSYKQLRPFEQRYTETLSYIGNENLDPIYINALRLSYLYNNKTITIKPAVYLNNYNDYWEAVTFKTGEEINGASKLLTTPMNVGDVMDFGGDLTITYEAARWLSFTAYMDIYSFNQSGEYNGVNAFDETIYKDFTNSSTSGSQSLMTKVKIPKVFDFQINVKNEMKIERAFSTRAAYAFASIAINKDFKNSSLSLSCNDIFNSIKTDRDRNGKEFFSNSFIKDKYQTVILSYTYRFNQSKAERKIDFDKKDIKPEY